MSRSCSSAVVFCLHPTKIWDGSTVKVNRGALMCYEEPSTFRRTEWNTIGLAQFRWALRRLKIHTECIVLAQRTLKEWRLWRFRKRFSVCLDRTLSKTVFCLQTGTICVCQGATQGKSYKSTFPFDITLCKRTTWMLLLHGTMVKHAYTDTFLRGLAMFSPSVLLAFWFSKT